MNRIYLIALILGLFGCSLNARHSTTAQEINAELDKAAEGRAALAQPEAAR